MKNAFSGRFPHWFVVWGWCSFLSALPLFMRLLYEETILTWRRGAQMVGFTMVHQFAIVFFIGMAGYLAMALWILFVLGFIVQWRRFPGSLHALYALIAIVGAALVCVPYSTWAGLGGVSLK